MLSFKQKRTICVKIRYGSIIHTNILKLVYRTCDIIQSVTDLNSDVRRKLESGTVSVVLTIPMRMAGCRNRDRHPLANTLGLPLCTIHPTVREVRMVTGNETTFACINAVK